MDNIPDWAGKRACELLNENQGYSYRWPLDCNGPVIRTVAKLVMQHETPPADPDEEAVKRILCAYWNYPVEGVERDCLARAVSQYKQEKANG